MSPIQSFGKHVEMYAKRFHKHSAMAIIVVLGDDMVSD